MEKNDKIISLCSVISAFMGVKYCCWNFYRGRTVLGVIWATLATAHMVLAILNYKVSKEL